MTEKELQSMINRQIVKALRRIVLQDENVITLLDNCGFTPTDKGDIISKWKDQPRDEKGRWSDSGGGGITTAEERQKKIDSINIDFDNDNILPGLNAETLQEFGFEDKPVLLKKTVLDKNAERHPEIPGMFHRDIIGNALYNPDAIIKGHSTKPYFNFIHSIADSENAIVLLQVEDTHSGFLEIVNFHVIDDRARSQKLRK